MYLGSAAFCGGFYVISPVDSYERILFDIGMKGCLIATGGSVAVVHVPQRLINWLKFKRVKDE